MKLNKKEIYKLLESSETYGTVLHAICMTLYGEEIYDIDSVELYARLGDDFGIYPHEDNESKLMAMITAISTPHFYQNVNVFESICKTLTSGDPGVVELGLEDPTLLEILWGAYEVDLNVEPIEYSLRIERLIDKVTKEEAFEEGVSVDQIMEHYNQAIRDMGNELKHQLLKAGFADIPALPKV
jgi:hypothetical protein